MDFNTRATAAMAPLRDGPLPRVTGPVYARMNDSAKAMVQSVGVSDINQVQAGKQLYGQFCSVCHGMGTISGGLIPDLRQSSDATREHFQQIVLQGALKPLGMPSFDDSLKPEEGN